MAGTSATERLARVTPDLQSPEQAAFSRLLLDGPRGPFIQADDGSLLGPFGALIRTPLVAGHLQALGLSIQSDVVLSARAREVVILLTAARYECRGEWEMHAGRARVAGLSEAAIDDLAQQRIDVADLGADERAALAFARLLLDREAIDDGAYRSAADELGERGLVELVVLVTYFEIMCRLFETFGLPG